MAGLLLAGAIAAIAGSAASSSSPPPYPIPPVPLRKLVAEAKYIAVAYEKPDSGGGEVGSVSPWRTKHVLEVETVLKGELDPGPIVVTTDNAICPAPARFHPGTGFLVFLDRTEDGDFQVPARSYGAKPLRGVALATYVERVKEQLELLALPDDAKRRRLQIDWLVRCAVDPVTRWEGAYELAPHGDWDAPFFEDDEPFELELEDFASELTIEQRNALRDAFPAAKSFDRGQQCLEEFFATDPDPRLLEWLVARLRACVANPDGEFDEAHYLTDRIERRKRLPK